MKFEYHEQSWAKSLENYYSKSTLDIFTPPPTLSPKKATGEIIKKWLPSYTVYLYNIICIQTVTRLGGLYLLSQIKSVCLLKFFVNKFVSKLVKSLIFFFFWLSKLNLVTHPPHKYFLGSSLYSYINIIYTVYLVIIFSIIYLMVI